jgi:hypothetical protein
MVYEYRFAVKKMLYKTKRRARTRKSFVNFSDRLGIWFFHFAVKSLIAKYLAQMRKNVNKLYKTWKVITLALPAFWNRGTANPKAA